MLDDTLRPLNRCQLSSFTKKKKPPAKAKGDMKKETFRKHRRPLRQHRLPPSTPYSPLHGGMGSGFSAETRSGKTPPVRAAAQANAGRRKLQRAEEILRHRQAKANTIFILLLLARGYLSSGASAAGARAGGKFRGAIDAHPSR